AADVEASAPCCAEGEHGGGNGEGDETDGGDRMMHEGGADHGSAREEIAEPGDAGAADAKAETADGAVGGDAAKKIADHTDDEREAGEETEGERGEMVFFDEVSGQPGDAEVERATVGNIRETEREGVAMAEQAAPVGPALVLGDGRDAIGDD